MFTDSTFVKRVFEMGEDQFNKVVQELLANETFVGAVQAIVNNSLKAKGMLDKNLRVALSAMSLPTVSDVDNLRSKLDELDQAIQRIEKAVSQIAAEESRRGTGDKRA